MGRHIRRLKDDHYEFLIIRKWICQVGLLLITRTKKRGIWLDRKQKIPSRKIPVERSELFLFSQDVRWWSQYFNVFQVGYVIRSTSYIALSPTEKGTGKKKKKKKERTRKPNGRATVNPKNTLDNRGENLSPRGSWTLVKAPGST